MTKIHRITSRWKRICGKQLTSLSTSSIPLSSLGLPALLIVLFALRKSWTRLAPSSAQILIEQASNACSSRSWSSMGALSTTSMRCDAGVGRRRAHGSYVLCCILLQSLSPVVDVIFVTATLGVRARDWFSNFIATMLVFKTWNNLETTFRVNRYPAHVTFESGSIVPRFEIRRKAPPED